MFWLLLGVMQQSQLAIEIDGDSHFTDAGQTHDQTRSDYLVSLRIPYTFSV